MVERALRARLQQTYIKGKSKKTSLLCLPLGQSWSCLQTLMGFPGGTVVNNPPATAGDASLFPELGRSLEKKMATQSSNVAWEIPWTEKPGGLQSMGRKESDMTE